MTSSSTRVLATIACVSVAVTLVISVLPSRQTITVQAADPAGKKLTEESGRRAERKSEADREALLRETRDSLAQPLIAARFLVQLNFEPLGGNEMQGSSVNLFMYDANDQLLLQASVDYWHFGTDNAKFYLVSGTDTGFLGKPIRELSKAVRIEVVFDSYCLPVGKHIIDGLVVATLNNQTELRFEIPSQIARQAEIQGSVIKDKTVVTLSDVADGIRPLVMPP